jgi:hypothetical protein
LNFKSNEKSYTIFGTKRPKKVIEAAFKAANIKIIEKVFENNKIYYFGLS